MSSRFLVAMLVGAIAAGASLRAGDRLEQKAEAPAEGQVGRNLLAQARKKLAAGEFAEAQVLVQNELAVRKTREAYLLMTAIITGLLEGKPEDVGLYQKRGEAHFFAGDFTKAVADFDHVLEKRPEQLPHHWQRGLALYAAAEFAKGKAQFEAHQDVNARDVENAVWHFLCVARLEDVKTARKSIYPFAGDRRVPMAQIHDLFAGKATQEEVIKAAAAAHDKAAARNQLCYAHLYLGLYEEALGNNDKALEHYKLAAIDYQMPHYMGETARVFYETRRPKAEKEQ